MVDRVRSRTAEIALDEPGVLPPMWNWDGLGVPYMTAHGVGGKTL